MTKYILNRFTLMLLMIAILVILSFMIIEIIPGDLAAMLIQYEIRAIQMQPNPKEVYQQRYQEIRDMLGLDEPVFLRLFKNLQGFIQPGLGIPPAIWDMYSHTIRLVFMGFIISMVIGTPLGVICAVKKGKIFDRASFFIITLFSAIPGFVIASFLWMNAVQLWRYNQALAIGLTYSDWTDPLRWVIPVLSVSLGGIATFMLLIRSNMQNVLNEDYIRMAYAKGLKERTVVWKHAFRNVLLTLSTVAGLHFAALLISVTAVEMVVRMPGLMSALVFQVMEARNVFILQSSLIIIGGTSMLINFIVDIIYGFADPRVRSFYKKTPN